MAKKTKPPTPKKFKKEKKRKWASPPKMYLNVLLIPFILVALVCIGLSGFAIYVNNKNWKLRHEKKDAELIKAKQNILKIDLRDKLTATGASLGLTEAESQEYNVAYNLRKKWINPGTGPTGEFIRQKEGKRNEPIESKDPRYIHFLQILEDMHRDILWWPPKLEEVKLYKRLAEYNKNAVEEKKRNIMAEKNERIEKLNDDIQEAQRAHQRVEEDYRRDRDQRLQTIDELKAEIAKRKKDYEREISIKINIIHKLHYEISQLTKYEAKDLSSTELDGEIILSNNAQGYAWIDIGSQDGLIKGLRFEVRKRIKNQYKAKGLVEVMEIEESMSKVNILYEFDRRDPITRGDEVITPFFERGKRLVFVMVGEPLNRRMYTNEDVKAAIRRTGSRLDDRVTLETDFLILGRDPQTKEYVGEENENYEKALQLGVIIMKEEEMFRYIGRMTRVVR